MQNGHFCPIIGGNRSVSVQNHVVDASFTVVMIGDMQHGHVGHSYHVTLRVYVCKVHWRQKKDIASGGACLRWCEIGIHHTNHGAGGALGGGAKI